METYHVGLLGLGLFVLLAFFAVISWRRRIVAQEKVLAKPLALRSSCSGNKCFYVATTFANSPLKRVIAYGLAHRGLAKLAVSQDGIQVERIGEFGFFIPFSDLIGTSTGAAVIDRAVENDGLVVIKWKLGTAELESHFRFVDAKLRTDTIAALSSLEGV
jgi:hypothetical protein